jgi:hypothetical protein
LAGGVFGLHDLDSFPHEPGETKHMVGFVLTQAARVSPAMERGFGNPKNRDEFLHRNGEAGLQVVEFSHGKPCLKKLNQFGRSEVLISGSRAGAMHAVMDNAGVGFLPGFAACDSLC